MTNSYFQDLTWTLNSAYGQRGIAAPKLYRKEERLTIREHSSSFGGVLVAHLFRFFLWCPIICLYALSSELWCPLRFLHKNNVRSVFISNCLQKGSYLIYVICACCIWWCPTHSVLFVCFVCLGLVYPMLPFSLDSPFLIAPSEFFNVLFL
jgi:hypothetical protein